MISFVIRSDHDKERLIAAIKLADWSFKIYLQPLFPKAKPDQYKYLFGVVYQRIADFVGDTNVWSVHEDMMVLFNVEYAPLPDGTEEEEMDEEPIVPVWEFRRKAGSEFTTISIAQYIELIRAYFITEHNLAIEDAHEILVNE
jgi:hypothetical protein